MPYVNIPESRITGAIATQVGNLQGVLSDKAYDLVNETIQDIRRNACPSLPKSNRLIQKVNTLSNRVSNIDRKIQKFAKLAKTIAALIVAIKIIYRLIKKLPIPQAVPPGFGLPIALSMIQADLMHMVKEKIKQGGDDSKGILEVLKTPATNLGVISRTLGRVSAVANGCRLEGVLRREVAAGRLRERTLNELGIVDERGEYIFSNTGPTLFKDFNLNRDGSFTGNEVDNIPGRDGTNTDDTSDNQLLNSLNALNGSGDVSKDVKDSIKDLLDTFKDVEDTDKKDNPNLSYTSDSGVVYKLEIQVDPQSPPIAPRRFAVAIAPNGVVVLKGPKSFSSSTKVLIEELKFRIDNQLP